MKFCTPHWNDLRAAIDERGLAHLVAANGEAAAKRMVREVRGTATDATFDPLMGAHWGIVNQAMAQGWRGPLDPIECPLCFVQNHLDTCTQPNCGKPSPAEWIRGCTDAMLQHCRDKGLVVTS